MTFDDQHVITVTQVAGTYDTPWYVGRCSCGRWKSGRYAYPGFPEEAGRQHVKAKQKSASR